MLREQLLELGDGVLHLRAVLVVDHNGQRELAEVLALHAHRGQRVAQLRDGGGFRVIDQIVLWAGVLPVLQIGDEAGLGVVMMTAALRDFLAGLRVIYRMPFGDDVEVGRDIEQALKSNGRVSLGSSFSVRTRR